jgi:hypothetical protein
MDIISVGKKKVITRKRRVEAMKEEETMRVLSTMWHFATVCGSLRILNLVILQLREKFEISRGET